MAQKMTAPPVLREVLDPTKPCFFPIDTITDAPATDVAQSDAEFATVEKTEDQRYEEVEEEEAAPPPSPPAPTASTSQVTPEAEAALLAEMESKLNGLPEALDKLPQDAPLERTYQRTLERRRFLRARKHDVTAAIEMYTKMLEWRRDNGVDTILDTPDPAEEVYQSICSHRHFGYDKDGHPVYWERTGQVRVGEVMKHQTEDDVVRRHVRMMEYALRRTQYSSQSLGRNIEKIIMVYDLTNLSYKPEAAGLRIFRKTCRIDQDYYPERLQRLILINAPLSFRGIWAIIRPWVDPKTAAKVLILGTDFKARLAEIVDEDQTPAEFGGSCHISFKNGDGCMPLVRNYPDPTAPPAWFDLRGPPSPDEDCGRYLTKDEIDAKLADEAAAAAAKKGGGIFGFFRRS